MLFGMLVRASGLSSIQGDLGESGKGISPNLSHNCV